MKIDKDFIALKGGEIKNFEVIKERVVVKHIKGHAGFEGNELADRMAGYTILAMNESYEVYGYDEVSDVLAMGEG